MKVVRIDTDRTCKIVNWEPYGGKIEGQNPDHVSLMALECKGLKFGMFGLERSGGWPINNIATNLVSKLKFPNMILSRNENPNIIIKGPVLLYDDNVDMTKKKWNTIQMYCKQLS